MDTGNKVIILKFTDRAPKGRFTKNVTLAFEGPATHLLPGNRGTWVKLPSGDIALTGENNAVPAPQIEEPENDLTLFGAKVKDILQAVSDLDMALTHRLGAKDPHSS